MNPAQQSPQVPGGSPREMRFLNIIAWVAVIDVLLLIPLIWASRWVTDQHDLVAVLGPIHGFLFMVLIGLCAYGGLQKWWGWWFPILVVVTLGPLGSLIGDWIVRRQLKTETPPADEFRAVAGANATGATSAGATPDVATPDGDADR